MDTKLFLLAAGALVLAACNSNETETPDPSGEIHLYTEVAAPTRAAEVPTDLQDMQFANGTKVSVMVTDNHDVTNDFLVSYPLQTYMADGIGGLSTSTKQYYPIAPKKIVQTVLYGDGDNGLLSEMREALAEECLGYTLGLVFDDFAQKEIKIRL